MIIALIIAALFGGGSLEVFYIDKIEKGVNKYVTDKDRKKLGKYGIDYGRIVITRAGLNYFPSTLFGHLNQFLQSMIAIKGMIAM